MNIEQAVVDGRLPRDKGAELTESLTIEFCESTTDRRYMIIENGS